MTTAPYGSWPSPISAAEIAAGARPVVGAHYLGDQIFLTHRSSLPRPRVTALRLAPGGSGELEEHEIVPPEVSIGSRVHEYGGGATAVAPLGEDGWQFFYVEFASQRVFRVTSAEPHPMALTPETGGATRHGDLTVHGEDLWLVTERHSPYGIRRAIARLGGAASAHPRGGRDAAAAEAVGRGTDFVAWPRVSPDGSRLAWVGWDHPRMPWDGTTLFVQRLDGEGEAVRLAGGPDESILQPEWVGAASLMFLSDRSGFWNPYSVDVAGAERGDGARPLRERDAPQDMGGPLWTLGQRWYAVLRGRLLAEERFGTSELVWFNRYNREEVVLDTGLDAFALADVRSAGDGPRALLLGKGRHRASGLYEFRLASGELVPVRLDEERVPPSDYLPEAELHTFTAPYERGARDVHAIVYPPRHPEFRGPEGERAPYVAFVHGGPTSQAEPGIFTHHAFFTSRGIGVVDVNYGGSSGYGREYRERLRGEWGVVDVEDTVTAVRGLVDLGYADPERLVISGGSAGGWTVLSALTRDDTFAAGASYYGVAELEEFVRETHDFESHYVDGLVGPLPEARELYVERAPLNNLEGLVVPVVLFQGLKDPVVPPAQAERFRAALESAGLVHALVAYEEEAHGFRSPDAVEDSLSKELSFYGQVLGFDTPGVRPLRLSRPSGRGRGGRRGRG